MKYNLKTSVFDGGIIEQVRTLENDVGFETVLDRWVIDTRKKEVEDALVSLGWTPPKKDKQGE